MMIKFLRHGTGSAAGAARYVLADTDHLGALREGVKTLRGNAEIFSAIADSCGFKQRYTSGVIAFAPEDNPTDQDIQDVLDSFEELAFAGLEKDDYHLFAVQHDEADGSKHIHVLVPRVHLGTKKSLNIAPPNHSSVFYPWRDLWNECRGWASPKDPARRRRLGKTRDGFLLDKQKQKKGLKLEKDEREFIVDSIEQGVRSGKIKNRADVENFLKNEFLTEGVGVVSRVVKNSISVRLCQDEDKLGAAMRLTGAFFDAGFDAESWLAVEQEKEEKGEPSQRPKKAPDQKVVQELELRVDEIKRLRAERQSKYYEHEREDIKDEDKLDLSILIKVRKSDDITNSRRASNVSVLRARVEDQYRDIKHFTEVEDELYAEVRELTNRIQLVRASISESSRQIADVTSRITDVRSSIQEKDNRIRDVRARLVVVDNQLNVQHETHKDALLTLFYQAVQTLSYAQINTAQLDLAPLLGSLIESQNIKTRDSVSLVKLFINSNEQALQEALGAAHQRRVDELLALFKSGIDPVHGLEPINFEWVKENLAKSLLEIARDFDYEIDAESIELFVAAHQADLIELVDAQNFDFDRPVF